MKELQIFEAKTGLYKSKLSHLTPKFQFKPEALIINRNVSCKNKYQPRNNGNRRQKDRPSKVILYYNMP
jgi:hypothetical protein